MDKNLIKHIDAYEIQKYQQNRYPMLFVDEIDEVVPGEYAIAHKMFSYNEWFFPIHFEDEPVVPGFVLEEMMAQTFIMTFLTLPGNKGMKTASSKINNVNFFRKVVPGVRVDIKAMCKSYRRGVAIGIVEGYIGKEMICNAEYRIIIPDVINKYTPNNNKMEKND